MPIFTFSECMQNKQDLITELGISHDSGSWEHV